MALISKFAQSPQLFVLKEFIKYFFKKEIHDSSPAVFWQFESRKEHYQRINFPLKFLSFCSILSLIEEERNIQKRDM